MSLIGHIKIAQVQARKTKLTAVAGLLTTLIGEAEMVGKNAGREVTDPEVVQTIKKFIKNIDETIAVLGDNDPRTIVAMGEKMTLERFLPKQLTQDELVVHIRDIHAGLLAVKDDIKMGDIMSFLKARFDGLYDGKLASALVKAELS